MKSRAIRVLPAVFIYPASVCLAFAARLLTLHILGMLFKAWNLTGDTLPFAPVWAQRLAAMSGAVSDLHFLVFLVLPLFLYAKRARFQKKHLLYAVFGMLLSALTVGTLLLTGSARMGKIRLFPYAGDAALSFLTDCFSVAACAYIARKTPEKIFPKHAFIRLMLSVGLQAAYWILSKHSLSPVLIVNACLSGLILHALHEETNSVLPEILFLSAFRFLTRFAFGYPDLGGAYPVSEPALTGAAGGLSHSVLITVFLSAAAVYIWVRRFRARSLPKGENHVPV